MPVIPPAATAAIRQSGGKAICRKSIWQTVPGVHPAVMSAQPGRSAWNVCISRKGNRIMASANVLYCVLTMAAFCQLCMAAPMEPTKYRGGECAGCHGHAQKLPLAHPDTKAMRLQSCKKCHTNENRDLRGKLPGSHYHLLANITCEQCHGKADKPEVPTMEQCIVCHGSTAKLAEKTKGVKPRNPHASPHYGTELDCTFCHHQHAKSENYCLQCHAFGFKIP